MEGARNRRLQQQQQQEQGAQNPAELGDGQTPTDPDTSELGGNDATDPSSASATGLEAVRMRLRESLAAKPGVGERGDAESTSTNM